MVKKFKNNSSLFSSFSKFLKIFFSIAFNIFIVCVNLFSGNFPNCLTFLRLNNSITFEKYLDIKD